MNTSIKLFYKFINTAIKLFFSNRFIKFILENDHLTEEELKSYENYITSDLIEDAI